MSSSAHARHDTKSAPPKITTAVLLAPTGRYNDAYRVSTVAIAFATILKAIGWLLGGLTAVAGIYIATRAHSNPSADNIGITLLACIIALFLWAIFFCLGVIVGSLGHLLRALLDTAVHTSPFMTDTERRDAMRL